MPMRDEDHKVSTFRLDLSNDGEHGGQVLVSRKAVAPFARATPVVISLTRHFLPERRRVEAFIEKTYAEKYGAQVHNHYPYLMSARDASGHILAAIGFRFACDESLFLEQYLDRPVEAEISNHLCTSVARGRIAELGSLASRGHGATFFLFMVLANYLHANGLEYAAITGTRALQRFFGHLGLDPRLLADAGKNRLPDGGKSWGRYYDKSPKVLFGDIAAGCRLLPVSRTACNDQGKQAPLFARLHRPWAEQAG